MDRADSCSLAPLQPNHPKSDRLLGGAGRGSSAILCIFCPDPDCDLLNQHYRVRDRRGSPDGRSKKSIPYGEVVEQLINLTFREVADKCTGRPGTGPG